MLNRHQTRSACSRRYLQAHPLSIRKPSVKLAIRRATSPDVDDTGADSGSLQSDRPIEQDPQIPIRRKGASGSFH